MKDFFVIVHEGDLYNTVSSRRALEVIRKLDEIRQEHPKRYVEISLREDEGEIPEGVPEPSSDLQILVCGAYALKNPDGRACCNAQVKALKKAGYHAKLNPTACMYAEESFMITDIEETLTGILDRFK